MYYRAYTGHGAEGLHKLVELVPGLGRLSPETKSLACRLLDPDPLGRAHYTVVSRLLTPEWLHAAEDRVAQGSEDAKLKANAVVGDGKIRQVLDFTKELIEDGNQALSGTGRILYCKKELQFFNLTKNEPYEGPYRDTEFYEGAIPAYPPPLLKLLYWSTAMASTDGSTKLENTSKSRMKELYTPLRGCDISSNSISIKLDEEVVGWSDGKIVARNNKRYMLRQVVHIGTPRAFWT
jgi:hypothetical protein